ncbi:ribonuclease H-like domain-containing protein [Alphaproteobacteria bacterium]|jgi:ribonuclease D|nr:ribonuclease H-like domain-containing protein [Alphaproteobacteria bacterium]MDB0033625.1 ribonuclease H-like domain-containing protein [Alphaproteobacteria bacterium]
MSNYQLFQNDLPLQSLKSFKGDITIDTETLGLNVKRDRLCLIQLRNESNKKVYLIQFDQNISSANSKNIKSLMEDKSLTKIFHYARFDMAVLKENLNINVKNIFCTKIASKLTRTYSSRHGLKDLVKEILNIELDKTEQTSDWSQKKLTKQQIQYAMNDVLYLSDLKKNLESKLLETKRLKTFKSIMSFLETRVELDLMGWENTDIFAHK